MAFTASITPRVLRRLDEIFAAPALVDSRYTQEPLLVQALLARQNTTIDPILKGGKCTGMKAWFFDPGAGTANVYKGSVLDPAITCDAPTASEGQTQGKDFDHNIPIYAKRKVVSSRCDNDLMLAEETSKVLYDAMYELRLVLQEKTITNIVGAAQQNLATLPSYITERAASNILEVDPANMTGDLVLNTLLEMDLIAGQNSIYDPMYLTGRNLRNEAKIAFYDRLNDNSRGNYALFNDYMGKIVSDVHINAGLDKLVAPDTNSTLAVSPNSYIFWNFSMFPEIPVMVDSSRNMWNFSIEDPILSWNDNGTMRKVKYDVEVWHTCTGYDAAYDRKDDIVFRVWCKGGFHTAPAGYLRDGVTQGYTGILHYVAV